VADAEHLRSYRARIAALAATGRRLAAERPESVAADTRVWQRDCASLIGDLSGGRKVHWLSRAFSEALLVHAPDGAGSSGRVLTEVDPAELAGRIVSVLETAAASLDSVEAGTGVAVDTTETSLRYAFVRDQALRASLAQADTEAEAAFAHGDFTLALVGSSSVLEALVTDAIERRCDVGVSAVAEWSFDARITFAERHRLISSACVRLPASARGYRDLLTLDGAVRPGVCVTEHEATRARQVLRVVTRDLAPGR
jgi:hypothetical protein